MRAVYCLETGDAFQLAVLDHAVRHPEDNEVRVRIDAASVSFANWLIVSGKYHENFDPPFVPGSEAAGEVMECGANVTGLRQGDRVVVHGVFPKTPGCFAEEVTLSSDFVSRYPSYFSPVQAAVFPSAYGTAFYALNELARLQPGEFLLVHGASGAVGYAAVQIGLAMGATVAAAIRNDDKKKFLQQQGAHHVINSCTDPLRETVIQLSQGRGADVVIDPIGGDAFDASLRCIAPLGRILVIGFASGRIPTVQMNRILFREAVIVGVAHAQFAARDPERAKANLSNAFALAQVHRLQPLVAEELSFSQATEALRLVAQRRFVGKPVLLPQAESGRP